jgi:hypothetical protein
MNPIEKVMTKRSTHFKVALAVAVLVLVLWLTGSSLQSLWVTPMVVIALWIAVQSGMRYRHNSRHA